MGMYGKYTTMVMIFSFVQISVGVLMFGIGIAFRVLVCSWITDASFGFWFGVLVFIGGIIGYCSATKKNYSYIGYYLCCNSFSIMFAFLVIFCHSLASVHFMHQIEAVNITSVNSSHSSNMSTTVGTTTTTTTTKPPTTSPPKYTGNLTSSTKTTPSITLTSTSNTTAGPTTTGPTGPRCYTHQTWSDYENGVRGMGLGASMIFLCFIEILMSMLSLACCWATTKVEPTRIPRRRATIQGTVSEMLAASQSFEMAMPRRRHGSHVTSNTFNVYDNEYVMSSGGSPTTEEYEGIEENIYETIPPISTSAQTYEEPAITNWYSTTAC